MKYERCRECNSEMIAKVKNMSISLGCSTTAIEIVADNICVACAIKALTTADHKMVHDMLKKLGFIK